MKTPQCFRWPRISCRPRFRSIRSALALAGLATVLATRAAFGGTYNVEHRLQLRPGGNVVPRVSATYYAHAWVREAKEDCAASAVVPNAAAQPVGWGEMGADRLEGRKGRIRNSGNGGGAVDANTEVMPVGAGGLSQTFTADATGCQSKAVANSTFAINPFGAGGMITGTIRVHGEATAKIRPPRRAETYAFSMAMVEAQGGRQLRNGNIRWGKIVRDIVAKGASQRRQVDPIDFTVRDLVTGLVHTGTLYSVIIEATNRAAGGFTWENGVVSVDVQDLNFSVGFPSGFTSRQGMAELEIRAGRVTASTATGDYAGMLPAVGATVPLTFPLPDEVDFDYDLGDFDGHDLEVGLNFDGAGEAVDAKQTEDVPTLTLQPLDPARPGSDLTLSWPVTEQPVIIETTTDFVGWRVMEVETKTLDGRVFAVVHNDGEPQRFFRLRLLEAPDLTPPTWVTLPECGVPMVIVRFSEPVALPTAVQPQNYQVLAGTGGTMRVLNVVPVDETTVRLIFEQPIRPGQPYALRVRGVADLAGNVVADGPPVSFGCPGDAARN